MTGAQVKLTAAQECLLRRLGDGSRITYSNDGDCGWIRGTNDMLADEDIWALRDLGFIDQEYDEREDDYGCDSITPAGRAALDKSVSR